MNSMGNTALPADKAALAEALRADLARLIAQRASIASDPADAADRRRLRAWQAARLARTYADLLANPRYRPAADFFLSDLYGARDPSRRDADMAQVVPLFARMLPVLALRTVVLAVRLEALSEELDRAIIVALREEGGPEALAALDEARYAGAFRRAGTRGGREAQIAVTGEIGAALDRLTKLPALGTALRFMRGPASAIGVSELHQFLERGFRAFRHMGDSSRFLQTIRSRETAILVQLYAGEARPFAVQLERG
jgi:hypothetical protein